MSAEEHQARADAALQVLRDIHVVPPGLRMENEGCHLGCFSAMRRCDIEWSCECAEHVSLLPPMFYSVLRQWYFGCTNINRAYRNELRRRSLQLLLVKQTSLGCEPGLCSLVSDYWVDAIRCKRYP